MMTEQEYNVLHEQTCAALSAQEMWDVEIYEPLRQTLRRVESPYGEANEYYRKYAMSEKDYLQKVYDLILEAYHIVNERRSFWEDKVDHLYEQTEEYELHERLIEARKKHPELFYEEPQYSEHELMLASKLHDEACIEALGEREDDSYYPEDNDYDDYTRSEILGLKSYC